MNRRIFRPLRFVLLAGWCLLFLRCETTEKSMVRAVSLTQNGQTVTVGLLYQAPEAAADASEASAETAYQSAEGETLEKALAQAEQALPNAADYRLCDYLLIDREAPQELLAAYEDLVLQKEKGRLAAKVCILAFDSSENDDLQKELPDKLLEKLQKNADWMPRLYKRKNGMLLPQMVVKNKGASFDAESVFRQGDRDIVLDGEETSMTQLLLGMGKGWSFWLGERKVTLRRCTVSVTLQGDTALLRLDCQLDRTEPVPDAAQCAQLETLCTETIRELWQQGVDVLHLQQRSALQNGTGGESVQLKNACPQLQADVSFLSFFSSP